MKKNARKSKDGAEPKHRNGYTIARGNGSPTPTRQVRIDPSLYLNRELSWLDFNERVLEEARDTRHPLLERVKFLAIFGSNLDEFYMIRVSGLHEQRAAGVTDRLRDGLSPSQTLALIRERVDRLSIDAHACWLELSDLLRNQGIEVEHYPCLNAEEQEALSAYFHNEVFPILTPLATDPGRPFPHISNLSLNLAVTLNDPKAGSLFARVKVPGTLPRLVRIPSPGDDPSATRDSGPSPIRFAWLEELIAAHVDSLFPGMEATGVYPFRVTRNADIVIQEDEADDLLLTVEAGIRMRHFGFVTRLEVTPAMPAEIRDALIAHLKTDSRNLSIGDGVIGLSSLMELMKLDCRDLKDPPLIQRASPEMSEDEDLFDLLSRRDLLLYHPYDSFVPVIGLIETAARDPYVRAIKQTLYRIGPSSPVVDALIDARDADTQVAVLVELKARFDEESNIEWTRRLEDAGVHVAYGLIGLKTHCKVLLVVRREPGGVRRYLHLGTGNYNPVTARIYTDFSLMTSDEALGEDASELFNLLTGYSRQTGFLKMLVAPINLRERMAEMIREETAYATAGRPARLIFKMNQLVDPEMIQLLYDASRAGVRIDLLVRGICCLRPGVEGTSENITVVSIVGRFLEHARAYYFENGGNPRLYLGSADLMQRNLDRRVEVLFPVEDPGLREMVLETLRIQLSDTVNARRLRSDGTYERVGSDGPPVNSQSLFLSGK